MKCPNCNETLLMTERNQIEIDYCPSCRGIWLDKGELDKMLAHPAATFPLENSNYTDSQTSGTYNNEREYHPGHNRPRKKKSFLGDLFDFD